MLLSAHKKIQEGEYRKPYHWYLKTNSKFRYNQVSRMIVEELGSSNHHSLILDAGCGDGRGTFEVASLLGEKDYLVGMDYSYRAVSYAKKLVSEKTFLVADLVHLPFNDNTFDGIVIREVLEHLEEREERICWQELYRVLKKGGKLVITAPGEVMPVSEKHCRHYNPAMILERFRQTNLQAVKIFGFARYPQGMLKWLYYATTRLPLFWKLWRRRWKIVSPPEGMIIIASAIK